MFSTVLCGLLRNISNLKRNVSSCSEKETAYWSVTSCDRSANQRLASGAHQGPKVPTLPSCLGLREGKVKGEFQKLKVKKAWLLFLGGTVRANAVTLIPWHGDAVTPDTILESTCKEEEGFSHWKVRSDSAFSSEEKNGQQGWLSDQSLTGWEVSRGNASMEKSSFLTS